MSANFNATTELAVFSADRKYRYRLTRDFGLIGEGACCFIMLNPSTADEVTNDPTVRRCIGYAKAFGCERMEVVNIFAYRSTDPQVLTGMSRDHAVGPDNDQHIAEACNASRLIICAWGNHGRLFNRAEEVLRLVRAQGGAKPMALKINRLSGQPSHPLYLRADAKPWEINERTRFG